MIRHLALHWFLSRALALLCVFVVAACQAALAPSYDQSLIDGVTAANEEAMVLFSEVHDGARPSRYAALAPKYDALIGRFDALRAQADARDTAPIGRRIARALSKGNEQLEEICGPDGSGCVNTSPADLEEIVRNFQRMKETTRTKGLTKEAVALHKGAYAISLHDILVVETALKG